MEVRIPTDQIELNSEQVSHPAHRQHLGDRLGKVAEVISSAESSSSTPEEIVGGQPTSERLKSQVGLVSEFFAKASEELGPEATMDEIWERVAQSQLNLITPWSENEDVDKDEIALSYLVANLLAVYDKEPEGAEAILKHRMWEAAGRRAGFKVLSAAQKNQDIQVGSKAEHIEPRSIIQQTQGFGGLFIATDKSVNARQINLYLPELKSATPEERSWFFAWELRLGNYDIVRTNFAGLNKGEIKNTLKEVVQNQQLHYDSIIGLGLENEISVEDVIDWSIEAGRNPVYFLNMEDMPKDEQKALFKKLLDDHITKERYRAAVEVLLKTTQVGQPAHQTTTPLVISALGSEKFTSLDSEDLERLLSSGVLDGHNWTSLLAFEDLSEGMLTKLQEAGVKINQIMNMAHNLAESDRKILYDQLLEERDLYTLLRNPDKFGFIPRSQLLDLARDNRLLSAVASSIGKWTDGSDKELIVEVLENTFDGGTSMGDALDTMPKIDTEWFISELEKKDDVAALVKCLRHVGTINELELLDRILMLEPNKVEMILGFDLKLFKFEDTNMVLEKLIAINAFEVIARNTDYFIGETAETILFKIGSTPEGVLAITNNIYKFPDADKRWLADCLVDNGNLRELAMNASAFTKGGVEAEWIYRAVATDAKALGLLSRYREDGDAFSDIPSERFFEDLMGLKAIDEIGMSLKKFKEPGMHARFVQACIDSQLEIELAVRLDVLEIDNISIAKQCLEAGWDHAIMSRWDENNFLSGVSEEDRPSAADLIEWGGASVVLCNTDIYPDADLSKAFRQVIERSDEKTLSSILFKTKLDRVPGEVAEALLDTESAWMIRRKKELFEPSVFTPDFFERYLYKDDESFVELYKYSGTKIEWLDKQLNTFGRDATPILLLAGRELSLESDQVIPSYIAELGVTRRGQAGIEQLKKATVELRRQLIYNSDGPDQLSAFVALTTSNLLAKSIAKQMTRFTSSQWGAHTEDEWSRVLESHLASKASHAPMPAEFVNSELYTVRTIDAKEFDPSKIDEDAKDKFVALQESLKKAFEIAESPANGRFSGVFTEGQSLLSEELGRLRSRRGVLVEQGKDKGVEALDQKIAGISEVVNMSPREFMGTLRSDFARLSGLKVKGFDEVLRIGMFAQALTRSSQARFIGDGVRDSKVTHDALVTMNDFVDHIVNQEVYGNYFRNEESRKAFERISDTTALRAQIFKAQSGQTSGRTSLQFVPTRGLALELSGHLGDACWASKYGSIAEEFPNISSLTYVRNPGTTTERIVGAGLIIDTVDQETGEPILVLRGTNPIENYINGVKVVDFFEALTEYAKSISNGRKVAIVIDNKAGSGATNRPVLFDYLNGTVKDDMTDGKAINLPADTTFNGYELTPKSHPVYLLS